jgi:hypothetical protein
MQKHHYVRTDSSHGVSKESSWTVKNCWWVLEKNWGVEMSKFPLETYYVVIPILVPMGPIIWKYIKNKQTKPTFLT